MAKYNKPRLVTLKPGTFHKLTILDVMCPVCHEIFVNPVTLPCYHGLCLQCFERNIETNNLMCPMCRKRIGGWFRTVNKERSIVNEDLWRVIQEKFPDQVRSKLNGEDDGVEEIMLQNAVPDRQICSPGKIKQEFEENLRKLQEEERKRLEREQRESEEYIRQLQEEEERQLMLERQRLQAQAELDEHLARRMLEESEEEEDLLDRRQQLLQTQLELDKRIAQELNNSFKDNMQLKNNHVYDHQTPSHSFRKKSSEDTSNTFNSHSRKSQHKKHRARNNFHSKNLLVSPNTKNNTHNSYLISSQRGPMDAYIVPKKPIYPYSSDVNLELAPATEDSVDLERSVSKCSIDSIYPELHHFKPIHTVPITPPKILSDGRVLRPKLVKSVPVNLNQVYNSRTRNYASSTVSNLRNIQEDSKSRLAGTPLSSSVSDDVEGSKISSAFKGTGINLLRRKAEHLIDSSENYPPRKKIYTEKLDHQKSNAYIDNYNQMRLRCNNPQINFVENVCFDKNEGSPANCPSSSLGSEPRPFSEDVEKSEEEVSSLRNELLCVNLAKSENRPSSCRSSLNDEDENSHAYSSQAIVKTEEVPDLTDERLSRSSVSCRLSSVKVEDDSCSVKSRPSSTGIDKTEEVSALTDEQWDFVFNTMEDLDDCDEDDVKKEKKFDYNSMEDLDDCDKDAMKKEKKSNVKNDVGESSKNIDTSENGLKEKIVQHLPLAGDKSSHSDNLVSSGENIASITEENSSKCNDIVKNEKSLFYLRQKQIEEMIRQEEADRELAMKLEREWNAVDRRKGSSRAYELRNTRNSTKKDGCVKSYTRNNSKKDGSGKSNTRNSTKKDVSGKRQQTLKEFSGSCSGSHTVKR